MTNNRGTGHGRSTSGGLIDAAFARRQLRWATGILVASAMVIVSVAASAVGQHPLAATRDLATMPLVTIHADTNVAGAKAI